MLTPMTMPLYSWVKNRLTSTESYSVSSRQAARSDAMVVSDSLLMELDQQMRSIETAHQERENEEQRRKTGVDYTWLVTKTKKSYQMPNVERLELEELCTKIHPQECGRIIETFRFAVLREPPLPEVPRLLRSIIVQTIESRPKEETFSDWVSKSFVSLRARGSANKVSPIDVEDFEMQQQPRYGGRPSRSVSMPVFTVQNEFSTSSS